MYPIASSAIHHNTFTHPPYPPLTHPPHLSHPPSPIDPSPPTLATIPRPPPTLLLRPPPSLLISALRMRSGRWVDNLRDAAIFGDPPSEAEISLQLVITIQTDMGQTGLR